MHIHIHTHIYITLSLSLCIYIYIYMLYVYICMCIYIYIYISNSKRTSVLQCTCITIFKDMAHTGGTAKLLPPERTRSLRTKTRLNLVDVRFPGEDAGNPGSRVSRNHAQGLDRWRSLTSVWNRSRRVEASGLRSPPESSCERGGARPGSPPLGSEAKYEMAVFALHEGVPGHHLQTAAASDPALANPRTGAHHGQ